MAQAEFDPVAFADKVGHLQGTLDALVDTVGEHHEENTKQFDGIYERLRRLESKNGWKGRAVIAGSSGAGGFVILLLEFYLRHIK